MTGPEAPLLTAGLASKYKRNQPMTRDDVVAAIYEAIGRANELRDPDQQIGRDEDVALFGPEGALDSLGLVSLVLDVEETVNDAAGTQVVLADERAMARKRSPFRDVRSLADYIVERLAEEGACPSHPSS